MNFKQHELEFLRKYNVRPDEVHDGQGQSQALRKIEAERNGKTLVIGPPCAAANHRLRTRAGHCVQCDPKKLAFQSRHTAPGFVYIAGSLAGRVIKIGTASNLNQRHKQLCAEMYGGLGDWELVFHMMIKEGGKIEQHALTQLKLFRTLRTYNKDGATQQAGEILQCSFSLALKALADAIGDGDRTEVWRSPKWQSFEFK